MSSEYRAHLQIRELDTRDIVKATSDNIPGLVAQGGTIAETVEIARDVARELIGSYRAC